MQDFLFEKACAVGQPLNGSFELTSRCNLRCRMCYIAEPASSTAMRSQELSSSEWINLAGDAAGNGMLFLCLTGGEPFLRNDFFDIYEPLTSMGLYVTLFTNATLITPAVAERLAQLPPSRLEVSLYGATKEVYEAVTGVQGSFRRCLSGIDAVLKTGRIPLLIKSTLSRLNMHELPAMRKLAEKRKVPFQAAWLLTARRDRKPCEAVRLRLPAEEIVRLEAEEGVLAGFADPPDRSGSDSSSHAFYCNAGKASFTIYPNGEMNLCNDLPFPKARPLETGFSAAWESVRMSLSAVLPSPVCSTCRDRHFCPWCPAHALLETGSFDSPVPYLCEIARERRRAVKDRLK